jgi:Fe2+ or Zn2+ uptake regulation protein
MHDELDYIGRIRQQGYRVTPQRQLILDTICQAGEHATATQIYERAQAEMPAINQATVYRVLDFLCQLRMVAKTEIEGQSIYEIVGETPHHHLTCRQCGKTEQLADYHFDALADHLLEEHGFKAEIDHLAISGLCADCLDRAGE